MAKQDSSGDSQAAAQTAEPIPFQPAPLQPIPAQARPVVDSERGRGGSYIRDPKTGERRLRERTQP